MIFSPILDQLGDPQISQIHTDFNLKAGKAGSYLEASPRRVRPLADRKSELGKQDLRKESGFLFSCFPYSSSHPWNPRNPRSKLKDLIRRFPQIFRGQLFASLIQ
jgi:hypothetical protein